MSRPHDRNWHLEGFDGTVGCTQAGLELLLQLLKFFLCWMQVTSWYCNHQEVATRCSHAMAKFALQMR